MKAELIRGGSVQNPNLILNNQQISSPLSGALRGCQLGHLDASCIEKLLLHCATALERNDLTLAQQVMWVLNNVASSSGDPNQRLTSYFLRALVSRATTLCPTTINSFDSSTPAPAPYNNLSAGAAINSFDSTPAAASYDYSSAAAIQRRFMSVTELASYVDLIPWHRFGFCVSNSAIFKAVEGCDRVHILDFSITHCMQWPTLIDALAKRREGPPSLCITVPSWRPPVPPSLNASTEEVGLRLANFAKFRDVPFEFKILDWEEYRCSGSSSSASLIPLRQLLTPDYLNLRNDEALVINCQNWLRYLPDHDENNDMINNVIGFSYRDSFLQMARDLQPRIVVVVDEDCDMSSPSLCSRITEGFNYLWIPFDALETFLPKESHQRMEYEADIGHKIENIVGFEGMQRIERLESGMKLSQRMKNVGFRNVGLGEETVKEVKSLLDEHASGWGMKKEEDERLVLTWKGHSSVYATAWVPTSG